MPVYRTYILPSKVAGGATLWWDADDMSTLNSGGVISDGTAITTWKDKMNGVVLTGTGTFKAAFQNGKNCLSFNGTSNQFAATNVSQISGHNSRSTFVVFKGLTTSGFRRVWIVQPNDGVNDNITWYYEYFSGTNWEFCECDSNGTVRYRHSTLSTDITNFHLFSARINGTGTNIKDSNFDNTSKFYQSTGSVGLDPTATNYLTVGNRKDALLGTNKNEWFNGYICELIYFNTRLSDRDYNTVRAYLQTKWGV